jgi:hypothetical protein
MGMVLVHWLLLPALRREAEPRWPAVVSESVANLGAKLDPAKPTSI